MGANDCSFTLEFIVLSSRGTGSLLIVSIHLLGLYRDTGGLNNMNRTLGTAFLNNVGIALKQIHGTRMADSGVKKVHPSLPFVCRPSCRVSHTVGAPLELSGALWGRSSTLWGSLWSSANQLASFNTWLPLPPQMTSLAPTPPFSPTDRLDHTCPCWGWVGGGKLGGKLEKRTCPHGWVGGELGVGGK